MPVTDADTIISRLIWMNSVLISNWWNDRHSFVHGKHSRRVMRTGIGGRSGVIILYVNNMLTAADSTVARNSLSFNVRRSSFYWQSVGDFNSYLMNYFCFATFACLFVDIFFWPNHFSFLSYSYQLLHLLITKIYRSKRGKRNRK